MNRRHLVNLPLLTATADKATPSWEPSDPDLAITIFISGLDRPFRADLRDGTERAALMFDRCVKRYGELEMGECYGLVPALALGGSASVESVQRVRALEHLAILAQLGQPALFGFPGGRATIIRKLGRQT